MLLTSISDSQSSSFPSSVGYESFGSLDGDVAGAEAVANDGICATNDGNDAAAAAAAVSLRSRGASFINPAAMKANDDNAGVATDEGGVVDHAVDLCPSFSPHFFRMLKSWWIEVGTLLRDSSGSRGEDAVLDSGRGELSQ